MTKKQTPLHVVFTAGYIIKDGKILIGRRSKDEGHLPGYWGVPGGKVELTSDVEQVLEQNVVAEVLEETGVTVSMNMTLFSNNSFIRTQGDHVVAMNFACQYISGEPRPLDGTDMVMWAGLDDLKELQIEESTLRNIKLALASD